MSSIRLLYEPILQRDEPAIRIACAAFAEKEGDEALFHAVSRFAALAFNPSQHGRHAFLAGVAAWSLRDSPDSFPEILVECAIYAAEGRLPWSEPPVTDPPAVGADHPAGLGEIEEAIEANDRNRGERWLAANLERPDLGARIFEVAARHLEDLGHPFIVAAASWKLSMLQDRHPSYAALRPAVAELCMKREGGEARGTTGAGDRREIALRLIDVFARSGGDPEPFHDLALFASALEAEEEGCPSAIAERVIAAAGGGARPGGQSHELPEPGSLAAYKLARDHAQRLKAEWIARVLERHWSGIDCSAMLAAADYNLRSSNFDEWSFA
ncbi:MAG TPA: hypothetical protein VM557_09510 [Thermoanaerobaculia bacterium]|nr:hypothetical protein [Thermoanaerobaculia bacterium]